MNKNSVKLLVSVLIIAILSGCSQASPSSSAVGTVSSSGNLTSTSVSTDKYNINWQDESRKSINLSEGSVEITSSGIYEFYGSLKEGSITVNVDKSIDTDTVYLVFNQIDLHSDITSPINIIEGKKIAIILAEDTVNTITQGENITTDESGNPSAAIYSKADLIITGTGTLNVETKFNDGITSKDDLEILSGTINITSVGDGLTGKDLLNIGGGTINITAGKDGIRSTNATDADKGNIVVSNGELNIIAENDGIQAEKILDINGGTINITSGGGYTGSIKTNNMAKGMGGRNNMPPSSENQQTQTTPTTETTKTTETTESMKAIKAGVAININGGIFTLSSYEDSIHSNGDININGGDITLQAGDDGIHADLAITIKSGEININNSYEGIEATNITIDGGNISLTSDDDGINISERTGVLTINGGTIYVNGGGDGIDSNGNIVQNGGDVVVNTQSVSQGNTAIDFDGNYTKNGGTLTDQNGNELSTQGGGMGGGKGNRPQGNTRPNMPEGATPPEGIIPPTVPAA